MTLSEIQTKKDALISKIADAYKQLQKGDKTLTYQDIDQMERALAVLQREEAALSGNTRSYRGRFIAIE